MKTRISVIIPVYNVEEFLNECVDSVLAQTINNMELTDGYERNLQILLIDDGSTDDSAKIIKVNLIMTLLFQGMKSVHTLLKAHSFSMIQQHGIN